MTLFLDACIVIYCVEAAEPFYSRVAGALREAAGTEPDARFAVSRLSLLECLVKPLREEDRELLGRYGEFFEAPDLDIVELSPRVIDIATQLRAFHGLRTPDALQAASALSLPGGTRFITGDPRFRKVPGLDARCV